MSGTSLTRHKLPRRWRHAASAAAVLAGVIPATIAAAAPAQAAAGTTPTAPPPVTILTSSPNDHAGDIFLTLSGDQTTYLNGPTILDPQGSVVWFHAVPTGQEASDFREQAYNGQPVLTWWQGTGFGGLSHGTDYIYSADGQNLVATVNAGNGLSADGHEFLITPWNTALILAYTTATANLTSIGGPPNQTVINGVVQEIDIKTGKVLFQWNSADHVPYSESETPLPASPSTPWDWFHINAVKIADDGSLLINGRDVWATYDVNHSTGNINWQLGGKDSTFTEQAANGQTLDSAGEIFAWEHDPQQIGPDTFTWFDNEASPTELPYSRSVTVHLDFHKHTATLVSSNAQPEGLSAGSQGNAQTATHGEQVVGWGALPYASTFSPSGQLVWNAQFPAGVNSYRAYRFPWPPDQNPKH
jgi:Arylsulfotransferase (ASST)